MVQPMNETKTREVVVGLEQGLHARPADLLAREARRWQSRIELVGKAQRVDGKSILELLTLAAEAGTRLVVEATGPDAREALDAIGSLFEHNFQMDRGEETGRDATEERDVSDVTNRIDAGWAERSSRPVPPRQ
jgi:phosphocarrier protein HPr